MTESEVKDMRKRIRELGRMLGRQTMRAEILEEALQIAGAKKKRSCPELRPAPKVVGEPCG